MFFFLSFFFIFFFVSFGPIFWSEFWSNFERISKFFVYRINIRVWLFAFFGKFILHIFFYFTHFKFVHIYYICIKWWKIFFYFFESGVRLRLYFCSVLKKFTKRINVSMFVFWIVSLSIGMYVHTYYLVYVKWLLFFAFRLFFFYQLGGNICTYMT